MKQNSPRFVTWCEIFATLVLVIAATMPPPSHAGPLDEVGIAGLYPPEGQSRFYVRTYDAAHLAANPTQKVQKIVVEFFGQKDRKTDIYIKVSLKGQKRPVYSATGYLDPLVLGSKSVRFGLFRESGSGSIEAFPGYIMLKLNGQDFMTLTTVDAKYGQGFDDEKMVTFSADDKAHRAFKLPAGDKAAAEL